MADRESDEAHHVGQHLRNILSLCQETKCNSAVARAGLAGGGQWEDKREQAERGIREGEEGMELGHNSQNRNGATESQTPCP